MMKAKKWVASMLIFSVVTLGLSRTNAGDMPSKPSREYEQELQRGGNRDLGRFEGMPTGLAFDPKRFKVPQENVRAYCDLAGLPKDNAAFGRTHQKLHHSPEAIKSDLLKYGLQIHQEIWRLHLWREEVSWTARVSAPGRYPKPYTADSDESWLWRIDPEQDKHPGWDSSLMGQESLRIRRQPVLSTSGAALLVQWRIFRVGGRYVTPRLKLADLKEVAPWFYQHIPHYVLDREEWFHFGETDSVAVYIDRDFEDAPRTVEFVGRYSFEGRAKEKQFDAFFHPDDFRRIHVRGTWGVSDNELNLSRPCRECDVLVLDAPHTRSATEELAEVRNSGRRSEMPHSPDTCVRGPLTRSARFPTARQSRT
jgi:hypothetical protein